MLPLNLAVLASSVAVAQAFYLPGTAPTSYKEGDNVPLLVNHITPSVFHESQSKESYVYSFDYYYQRLHFCQPEKKEKQPESLGSIIFGDRIYNSPFELTMLKNETCKSLCTSVYPAIDSTFVHKLIKNGFFYNWLVDGLPAARRLHDKRTNSDFYGSGFELGYVDEKNVPHLDNHFNIQIEYHKRDDNEYRVVGVTVEPHSWNREEAVCPSGEQEPVTLDIHSKTSVPFTYDVTWIESDTLWATRWDKYLHVYDPKIQWFSLVNFSLIVVCLSLIIAHILFKALKTDISKYNEMNLDDDMDETGWKLVHGDVFRSPRYLLLLSVVVGSGVQLLLMALTACGFALLGLLSPSNRGSLSTVMFILYALFGCVGSFVSGSVYKFFDGSDWKINMLLTPTLIPGVILLVVTLLNFFLIGASSSGAIPAGTLLAIIVIWFIMSVPLSVVGSVLAVKKESLSKPVHTNQIPRQIPAQPWYLKTWFAALVAGIFPFGSLSVEMYFIYSSLWFNRVYYMFGFLFFCFLLMVITTSLVTILMTYYSLCAENYLWQWRSIVIAGGCALYVFLHAILLTKFQLGGFVTIVLYTGYSLLISFLMFVLTGSIGFISSLFFVRKIYSSVKID
ncbi:CYFA0S01e07514g1_1 [Cyberlindnera fabianii]|uniref:Transmembrane 9 superfamily member n=1 Tax=Cyberlindnera fabianii TaxID=36022 RepID=A0A061AHS3_CYBFA|nr:CYFA0S01e07514g1_1 [Cyberlindnera fabianii]